MDIKELLRELQSSDDPVRLATSADALLHKAHLAEEIDRAIRVDRAVVPEDVLESLSEFGRRAILLVYVAHIHQLAMGAHRNLTAKPCTCIKRDR